MNARFARSRQWCVWVAVSLTVLLGVSLPAAAQGNTTGLVVATCGTVSPAFNAGNPGPFTIGTDGKLCVNASVSVSASISGFTPAGSGAYANLTATGSSSASTALPSGTEMVVVNTGTTAVSCTPAAGAATGTRHNIIVAPGVGWFAFATVSGGTTYDHIACIDEGGSDVTSNLVTVIGGSGLPTGTGGGGGSGGGGSVTQGTTPWVVSNAGTFATQAAQSGTWNITNVSGTISLPTGAATAANQATEIASLSTIAANTGAAIPAGAATIGQILPLTTNAVWGTTAAMTGTTSTALIAGTSSKVTYVTSISCVNSHATVGTFVTVQDGSGGTTLGTLAAASVFGGEVMSSGSGAPLFPATTAGNGVFVADVTTGANVICTASGFHS